MEADRIFKSYGSFIPTDYDVFRNPRPVLEVRDLYIDDILGTDYPKLADGSSELRHFRTLRPTANPDFGALFGEKRVVLAESEISGSGSTSRTGSFINDRLQFVLESVGEGTPRVGFGWDEVVYYGDLRTRRQSPLPTNRDIFERGLPLQVKRIRYKTNRHGICGEDLTVALLQPDGKYEVATPIDRKISEMDDSAIVVKSPQGVRAWVPHHVNVSIDYVKPSDVTLYVPTS